MPKYQYVCRTCQNEFQLRRPCVDARKKAPCPECGADGRRLLKLGPRQRD